MVQVTFLIQTETVCPEPQTPDNGTVSTATSSTSNNYGLDSVATYSCNTGFVLVGQTTRVCDDVRIGDVRIGTWSGSLPTCEGRLSVDRVRHVVIIREAKSMD